jgi:hypothetical protein
MKDGSSNKEFDLKVWGITPAIDAACCIASKNRNIDGTVMFDTYKRFGNDYSALGRYVRERLKEKCAPLKPD